MAGTIQAARSSGIGAVHLSLSPSAAASDSVLARRVERAVATARDAGLQVSFGIAEATRLDVGTVCALLAAAETAGAHRFRYADTMGVLHPLRTHRLFRDLCAETDLELEFEGHDEFGMATANALAAVQAGATHVSVSCLGRRIASLRGVIAAIHLSPMHHTHVAPARLGALAVLVGSGAREVAPHDERTDLARRCAVASHGGAPSLQLAAE
jgi:homocitrate synthase NifV